MQMLCRNKVKDFNIWYDIFTSHQPAQLTAGLKLLKFWRNTEDPNEVFFLFDITDINKARAFVTDPQSAETGKKAGVIEGNIYYLDELQK